MKALVTGGAGFIGMSLVNDLLARDIEVRVLDRTRGGLNDLRNPALEIIEAGIEDRQAVQQVVQGIDVIF
jgi:nucleoside-diphosphate-sugar epimerase